MKSNNNLKKLEENKENLDVDGENNLKKKSKNLQLLIEKYKKELEEVRSDCSHKESKPKLVVDKNGTSASLRIVCVVCDMVVGYPSSKELNEFYKEK